MANIDAAFGLRPFVREGSSYNNQGMNAYAIQTADTAGVANEIFTGQGVIPLANGLISYAGAAAGGTVPYLGVFMGCKYTALDGTPTWSAYYPGTASVKSSTEVIGYVIDDPNALFVINCDAAAADGLVFANANFATSITGSTTLNLRILGFEDSPSSDDATAAGRLAIVKLNVHFLNSTTGIN
jgi:hypothetical protein